MNIDRFQTRNNGFDVVDLRARLTFKTISSIGFDLAMKGEYFVVIGSMQVHHPCDGHIKARIYLQLPKQYRNVTTLREIGMQAFRELDIPPDETYEFQFDLMEDCMVVEQRVDRDGRIDGIGSYA